MELVMKIWPLYTLFDINVYYVHRGDTHGVCSMYWGDQKFNQET
jgi:hypothetical protein